MPRSATPRTCLGTRTSTPTSPAKSFPYAPDAWVDHSKTKEGAEIPFTRHFYQYIPPRPLEEIDRDLDAVMDQLRAMLVEVER